MPIRKATISLKSYKQKKYEEGGRKDLTRFAHDKLIEDCELNNYGDGYWVFELAKQQPYKNFDEGQRDKL